MDIIHNFYVWFRNMEYELRDWIVPLLRGLVPTPPIPQRHETSPDTRFCWVARAQDIDSPSPGVHKSVSDIPFFIFNRSLIYFLSVPLRVDSRSAFLRCRRQSARAEAWRGDCQRQCARHSRPPVVGFTSVMARADAQNTRAPLSQKQHCVEEKFRVFLCQRKVLCQSSFT